MKKAKKGKMKYRNRGVTMVELIVTFALLAIFMTVATMCISHAIIFYYNERQTMNAISVADIVFAEVKNDIRTMQGSDYNGYVKVREKNAANKLVAVSPSGGEYKGSTLEFVLSNINDGACAVQIDTNGCKDALIDAEKVRKDEVENIDEKYLTMRYYNRYPEKNIMAYKTLYMDRIVSGTSAEASGNYSSVTGGKVCWHAQEKLPKQLYQDYTIELEFSVVPEAPDANGKCLVKYVDVTVIVNNTEEQVYKKNRRVALQNKVYYNNDSTMYSDIY